LVQRSATVVPQSVHAPPGAPQLDSDIAWHTPLLSQQPLGHEAALQTHWPPWHCWPVAHAWPRPPHTHCPVLLLQRSASFRVLQSVQNWPLRPQRFDAPPTQTPSWQQPLAHVVLSQPEQWSPVMQVCPASAQFWHAIPSPPHVSSPKPAAQTPSFVQQPWQTEGSQWPASGTVPPPPEPPPIALPPPVAPSPLSLHMTAGTQRSPTPTSRQHL
jgi:hypothetical protein